MYHQGYLCKTLHRALEGAGRRKLYHVIAPRTKLLCHLPSSLVPACGGQVWGLRQLGVGARVQVGEGSSCSCSFLLRSLGGSIWGGVMATRLGTPGRKCGSDWCGMQTRATARCNIGSRRTLKLHTYNGCHCRNKEMHLIQTTPHCLRLEVMSGRPASDVLAVVLVCRRKEKTTLCGADITSVCL